MLQVILPKLRYLSVLAVTLLLLGARADSATLGSETISAWSAYVSKAKRNAARRALPGQTFLWASENPERFARVKSGEIVVGCAEAKAQHPVPKGLIHHWVGAAFLSGVRMADAVEITSDYDRYKDYYRPSVVASKVTERTADQDKFSMLLMNRALFLQTALEADYLVRRFPVDENRLYSVSETTRVQELRDYGTASEQRLPEGEGGGYIWRLFSIIRFEQKDGGVYVEVEVLALSRDIPAALRFFVEPIVQSVSRNSLVLSLQQTQTAIRGTTAANRTPALAGGSASLVAVH